MLAFAGSVHDYGVAETQHRPAAIDGTSPWIMSADSNPTCRRCIRKVCPNRQGTLAWHAPIPLSPVAVAGAAAERACADTAAVSNGTQPFQDKELANLVQMPLSMVSQGETSPVACRAHPQHSSPEGPGRVPRQVYQIVRVVQTQGALHGAASTAEWAQSKSKEYDIARFRVQLEKNTCDVRQRAPLFGGS